MRAALLAGFACCSLGGASVAAHAFADPLAKVATQDDGDEQGGDAPDPDDPAVVQARIERLIGLASTGRPVVRPQAAQRLVEFGAEALPLLRARVGEDGEGLEALGPDLVEVIADFGDVERRKRLWWQLDEPDFPWRPQAMRSLARSAQESERGRFLRLVTDRLAQVRAAAVEALGKLGVQSAPEAGARAGLALLDRLEAALGHEDCRLHLLRAGLLADVPGDEALRAREEACARAREACHRPSEQRLLERACGAAAER